MGSSALRPSPTSLANPSTQTLYTPRLKRARIQIAIRDAHFPATNDPVKGFLWNGNKWTKYSQEPIGVSLWPEGIHRLEEKLPAVQQVWPSITCDRTLAFKTSTQIVAVRFENSSDRTLFIAAFAQDFEKETWRTEILKEGWKGQKENRALASPGM
ncbi:hypothetical protein B0H14DRAFT_2725641 [Mycena olivaceomarginata]|nr:hypothetical protein B0H14DRAFT_2725641 [Mycena olivaceomarginata]